MSNVVDQTCLSFFNGRSLESTLTVAFWKNFFKKNILLPKINEIFFYFNYFNVCLKVYSGQGDYSNQGGTGGGYGSPTSYQPNSFQPAPNSFQPAPSTFQPQPSTYGSQPAGQPNIFTPDPVNNSIIPGKLGTPFSLYISPFLATIEVNKIRGVLFRSWTISVILFTVHCTVVTHLDLELLVYLVQEGVLPVIPTSNY